MNSTTYTVLTETEMIKLHLGCGSKNFGNEWTHIDGGGYDHLDGADITKLKFKDRSVDIIYASHVFEYFDREKAVSVLNEWFRVLKGGGILRIAVPDFYQISKLYIQGEYPLQNFLGPLYGKMNMSKEAIYHKTVYDFFSLSTLLQSVGFDSLKKYNWRDTEHSNIDDCSQAYLPHMDKENGILISLNVEAAKCLN